MSFPNTPASGTSAWIKASAILGKRTHNLQSPRPGDALSVWYLALNPIQDNAAVQWPTMPSIIDKTSKRHQLGVGNRERKAKATTLVEILLNQNLHRATGTHSDLPGHGIATSASRFVSTLV
jgi:hypothetical protein